MPVHGYLFSLTLGSRSYLDSVFREVLIWRDLERHILNWVFACGGVDNSRKPQTFILPHSSSPLRLPYCFSPSPRCRHLDPCSGLGGRHPGRAALIQTTRWGHLTTLSHVERMSAFDQIVLKKSFSGGERKFKCPLMRFAWGDVRDRIISHKNDHRPPVSAVESAAVAGSKIRLSRDFSGRSIFAFCNSIDHITDSSRTSR
jgi:hypothetical protein